MDPLAVSIDQLKASSEAFATIGDTAHQIAGTTSNAIHEAGSYAGNDPFGDAYNRLVGPGIDGITKALDNLGEGMTATAGKLRDTATLYKASDQVNAESVPSVHPITPIPGGSPITPPPAPGSKGPRRG
jgi:hypothetical protein